MQKMSGSTALLNFCDSRHCLKKMWLLVYDMLENESKFFVNMFKQKSGIFKNPLFYRRKISGSKLVGRSERESSAFAT